MKGIGAGANVRPVKILVGFVRHGMGREAVAIDHETMAGPREDVVDGLGQAGMMWTIPAAHDAVPLGRRQVGAQRPSGTG